MSGYKYRATCTAEADGEDVTFNIANFAIGEVDANATGALPAKPPNAGRLQFVVEVENTGTALAWFTSEALEDTTYKIPAGTTKAIPFGPWDWAAWNMVLQMLDGAIVLVSVSITTK